MKYLIVNADDFGLTEGVNRGIFDAHEKGIVTSASLMVRAQSAEGAAAYARSHPSLDVGLHIDLGEWRFQNGDWIAVYEVAPVDDAEAVREEILRQLEGFRRLTGRDPSHVDSHQHVHLREPVRSVLMTITAGLRVPLRHLSPLIRYEGGFYGQSAEGATLRSQISADHVCAMIADLPPGVTELACHPGYGAVPDTMYNEERALEVQVLCEPSVRTAIQDHGVRLISFAGLSSLR
jgi:predicted glycoside hydrolase/deacetylase ChbG (UPF0249 family)